MQESRVKVNVRLASKRVKNGKRLGNEDKGRTYTSVTVMSIVANMNVSNESTSKFWIPADIKVPKQTTVNLPLRWVYLQCTDRCAPVFFLLTSPPPRYRWEPKNVFASSTCRWQVLDKKQRKAGVPNDHLLKMRVQRCCGRRRGKSRRRRQRPLSNHWLAVLSFALLLWACVLPAAAEARAFACEDCGGGNNGGAAGAVGVLVVVWIVAALAASFCMADENRSKRRRRSTEGREGAEIDAEGDGIMHGIGRAASSAWGLGRLMAVHGAPAAAIGSLSVARDASAAARAASLLAVASQKYAIPKCGCSRPTDCIPAVYAHAKQQGTHLVIDEVWESACSFIDDAADPSRVIEGHKAETPSTKRLKHVSSCLAKLKSVLPNSGATCLLCPHGAATLLGVNTKYLYRKRKAHTRTAEHTGEGKWTLWDGLYTRTSTYNRASEALREPRAAAAALNELFGEDFIEAQGVGELRGRFEKLPSWTEQSKFLIDLMWDAPKQQLNQAFVGSNHFFRLVFGVYGGKLATLRAAVSVANAAGVMGRIMDTGLEHGMVALAASKVPLENNSKWNQDDVDYLFALFDQLTYAMRFFLLSMPLLLFLLGFPRFFLPSFLSFRFFRCFYNLRNSRTLLGVAPAPNTAPMPMPRPSVQINADVLALCMMTIQVP